MEKRNKNALPPSELLQLLCHPLWVMDKSLSLTFNLVQKLELVTRGFDKKKYLFNTYYL